MQCNATQCSSVQLVCIHPIYSSQRAICGEAGSRACLEANSQPPSVLDRRIGPDCLRARTFVRRDAQSRASTLSSSLLRSGSCRVGSLLAVMLRSSAGIQAMTCPVDVPLPLCPTATPKTREKKPTMIHSVMICASCLLCSNAELTLLVLVRVRPSARAHRSQRSGQAAPHKVLHPAPAQRPPRAGPAHLRAPLEPARLSMQLCRAAEGRV